MTRFRRIVFFVGMQSISFCSFSASEDFPKNKVGRELYGGHLQYHLIDEAISTINQMDTQDLSRNLKEAIVDFANAAISAAKDGDVITASRALDACGAILIFNKAAVHYVYQSLGTNPPAIGMMLENIDKLSLDRISLRSQTDVETRDLIHSFIEIAYFLGKLAYTIAEHKAVYDLIEMDLEDAENVLKKYLIDTSLFFELYEHGVKYGIIFRKNNEGAQTKDKEYLRLLSGITKFLSVISKENLPLFLNCVDKAIIWHAVEKNSKSFIAICSIEYISLMHNIEYIPLIHNIEKINDLDVRHEMVN